jgi:hypothetical protein
MMFCSCLSEVSPVFGGETPAFHCFVRSHPGAPQLLTGAVTLLSIPGVPRGKVSDQCRVHVLQNVSIMIRTSLVIAVLLSACTPVDSRGNVAKIDSQSRVVDPNRVEDLTTDAEALGATSTTNAMGVWVWYLEGTGYTSHSALAKDIASMGAKRVYLKVADGAYDPSKWPEVDDASIPAAYKARGLEVFAWSYNYPGNEAAQAKALSRAARAGYQGYVTDIEIEFDGLSTELRRFMQALTDARAEARRNGWAGADFKLYECSWGNPRDHRMRVDIMDEFVDGHMPQTYVEAWGGAWLANIPNTIAVGTKEYRDLGAKKPIFHVVSDENRGISVAQLNTFVTEASKVANSGSSTNEVSVWRIPNSQGGIWTDLRAMRWDTTVPGAQTVTLDAPASLIVGQSATLSGTVSAGVRSVSLSVDGFVITPQAVVPQSGRFSIQYTFTQAGSARALVVAGKDAAGATVATARRTIAVTPAPVASTITLTSGTSFSVGVAATMAGTVTGQVASLTATVDGFALDGNGGGAIRVTNGAFSFPVTFSQAGTARQLVLKGLSSTGAVVTQTTKTLSVVSNTATVPRYFYQYNNSINPGGSCQNTSIAMILGVFGSPATLTPDGISGRWGTSRAQTVAGFKEVFDGEARSLGLAVRALSSENSTITDVRTELAAGRPVVVHGYFTSFGHVLVLTGFDAAKGEYTAFDPAGRWSQQFKVGGYSGTNSTEGRGVRYRASAVDQAIGFDGKVWLHRFR